MPTSTPVALVGGGNGNNPIVFGIIVCIIVIFIVIRLVRFLRRKR